MTDFIITFRETLEAALVVGIVLSHLAQTNAKGWFKIVYWAIGLAIMASIVAGYIFESYLGGFEGLTEQIYEGAIMLTAAALISWMVLWMARQSKHISGHIKEKIDQHVQTGRKIGIFFLVFLSVLREGIETVLFLKAAALQAGGNNLMASVLGIGAAIILGALIFSGLRKVNMKRFFQITSVVLVLFAAGLVAHGVHEFQEAGVFPVFIEQVWDLNPAVTQDGVYPLLHENGTIGSLLKGVFGWNGNPSLLEVASYFAYLLLMIMITSGIKRAQWKTGAMEQRESNRD
ncbi:MAG: FTR1 family protein [bacterium]|nr:FTR1 family protein [bacterium]